MSRSSGGPGGMFGRLPDGWEAPLLVLFVPATIASILRYVSFRLRYDDHELVIRSGLIFRNERHIPFPRIQNVDASQNVFHRLFGVVEVRVETGGGKEEEARLSVLPFLHGRTPEQHGQAPGTQNLSTRHPWHLATKAPLRTPTHRTHGTHPVLVHLPLKELLLFGFLENKGMVLIGAAMGIGWESGISAITSRVSSFETTPAHAPAGFFLQSI